MKRAFLPQPLVYFFLILLALVFVVPLYMMLTTAFKDPSVINLETAWHLPPALHWQSFTQAWDTFLPTLRNSFVLTISATLLSAILGSLNGYVLAKWPFPGSSVLFALMLFGMFIPYQSVLIPLFQTLKALGLYGTLYGLILAHVVYGLPITTLIFKNYYSEVPDELMEAARVDGAGFFQIFAKVILPISVPGFVVVVIWQFTQV